MYFVAKMMGRPEPGGVNWIISVVVPAREVEVDCPAQIAIEALGTVDVRDRDDDDVELHVDGARDGGFSRHFRVAARLAPWGG